MLGLGFFADGLGRRRIGRGGFIFTLAIAQILSLESGIIAPIGAKLRGPLVWRSLNEPVRLIHPLTVLMETPQRFSISCVERPRM